MTNQFLNESFGFDEVFFRQAGIETVVLKNETGDSKILIVPDLQCRVMTSTASGDYGYSYGWINYALLKSKAPQKHIHAYGGEERLWLGPEGGPYSFYFAPGTDQMFENWYVPAELDIKPFDVYFKNETRLNCGKKFTLINAAGNEFKIEFQRSIHILEYPEICELLKLNMNNSLKVVAYETENTIINKGNQKWDEKYGAPSIWMLSMLKPSEQTNIFIPYRNYSDYSEPVNDHYFGYITPDRLLIENGHAIFRADGKKRGKIGIGLKNALNSVFAYSSDKNNISLLKFSLPVQDCKYVNSQWGPQNDPYSGDVVNAYNDGPLEDGTQMGPFYELESSSPAAFLNPDERMTHRQQIFHIEGDRKELLELIKDW